MSRFRSVNLLLNYLKLNRGIKSYSQCGEDLILFHIFNRIGFYRISYLDVGCGHPIFHNNTYFFYKRGSKGVCVEPDPAIFNEIRRKRNKDICLNIGVGPYSCRVADFYVMSRKTNNTFSKNNVAAYLKAGSQVVKIIKVPLLTINEVIQSNFLGSPDLISIDIEGLDLPVMKSFDFKNCRPKVFIIETGVDVKIKMNLLMENFNYFRYASTGVNSIFVDLCCMDKLL